MTNCWKQEIYRRGIMEIKTNIEPKVSATLQVKKVERGVNDGKEHNNTESKEKDS